MSAVACSTFSALPWDPSTCRCGAMIEQHELSPALAMTVAASKAVADTLSKPRAPLLANLIGCVRCGHEQRFAKIGRGLYCTGCGSALSAESMSGPVPTPPFPTTTAHHRNGQDDLGSPEPETSASDLLPTDPHPTPGTASLSAPGVASAHGARGNRSDLSPRAADQPEPGPTCPEPSREGSILGDSFGELVGGKVWS